MTTYDDMDKALWDFQWAYPDRGNNRGEIHVDRETNQLVLVVFTQDNEDPDNEMAQPLDVRIDFNTYESPEAQIRDLIHGYLTHEADEQMWFGNERPFYPHHEHANQS
jgi:hypothetical protein